MSLRGTGEEEHQPTRKQRREQARSERRALEQAQIAGAVRRARLTQLGIVIAIVVIAIIAVLLATGNGKSPGSSPAEHPKIAKEVTALVSRIPQSANVLGKSTAPVAMQYFGDLECPVCRAFTISALPAIIQKWVRAGELKIEYRSMETATDEPEVFKAQQVAALAAGKQDKLWNFIETFYHEQGEEHTGYVTEKYIQGIAAQVPGLNLSQWTSARGDAALASAVASDEKAANAANIGGTPGFLIGRSGGAMKQLEPSSFTEAGSFDEAIEKLLRA